MGTRGWTSRGRQAFWPRGLGSKGMAEDGSKREGHAEIYFTGMAGVEGTRGWKREGHAQTKTKTKPKTKTAQQKLREHIVQGFYSVCRARHGICKT